MTLNIVYPYLNFLIHPFTLPEIIMSFLDILFGGRKLKTAKKLAEAARNESGETADQLYKEAYDKFASISESSSNYSDALYQWGFALLHQAESKSYAEEAAKIYEEAITKFSFCQTVSSNHLGAAVDGGVALLGLAKVKNVDLDNEIYAKARASFEKAEQIQEGTASYNLACMAALANDKEACQAALEKARSHGLLPDVEEIKNDEDLKNVKRLAWFKKLVKELEAEKKEEEERLKEIERKKAERRKKVNLEPEKEQKQENEAKEEQKQKPEE
jgi:hypothetical protein